MEQVGVSTQQNLTISYEMFRDILRLKEELEGILETIEIMNDKESVEGLRRSMEDVKAGRVYELKSVDDLDELWSE
ncbi:MAG: hypothetical protein ACE5KE_06865 [Methanosarcinales archaeon]